MLEKINLEDSTNDWNLLRTAGDYISLLTQRAGHTRRNKTPRTREVTTGQTLLHHYKSRKDACQRLLHHQFKYSAVSYVMGIITLLTTSRFRQYHQTQGRNKNMQRLFKTCSRDGGTTHHIIPREGTMRTTPLQPPQQNDETKCGICYEIREVPGDQTPHHEAP